MNLWMVLAIIFGVALLVVLGILRNDLYDLRDRVDLLENGDEARTKAQVTELAHTRAENTRLRRRLGEYNNDDDVFQARVHHNMVKRDKVGGSDELGLRTDGESRPGHS